MAERLFQRRCVVQVDNLVIEDLRVAFRVHKDVSKVPNTAEVLITNLSETTRSQIQKKGARVIVSVGYEENLAVVFIGDSRTTDHLREGPDWVTKIQCGDGERVFQFTRVAESFRAGTPAKAVLDHLIDALKRDGLDPGEAKLKLSSVVTQFVNGYTLKGKAVDALDVLLNSNGYEWSIQNNRLQVLKEGETVLEEAVQLSPETGLVGSPEHGSSEKKGGAGMVKLRSLLQPRLRPAGKVIVESEGVRGTLRIQSVDHRGDTAGSDWYSELEAIPV